MAQINVNLPVLLTRDVPQLGLRVGDAGVVCSVWMSATAYQVEFQGAGNGEPTRALLLEDHLEVPALPGTALRIVSPTAAGAAANQALQRAYESPRLMAEMP